MIACEIDSGYPMRNDCHYDMIFGLIPAPGQMPQWITLC